LAAISRQGGFRNRQRLRFDLAAGGVTVTNLSSGPPMTATTVSTGTTWPSA